MDIKNYLKLDIFTFLSQIRNLENKKRKTEFEKLIYMLSIQYTYVNYNKPPKLNYPYSKQIELTIKEHLMEEANNFIKARLYHYLFVNKCEQYDNAKKAYDNYILCISKNYDVEFNCYCLFFAYNIYLTLNKQLNIDKIKEAAMIIYEQIEFNNRAAVLHFYNLFFDFELIQADKLLAICDLKMEANIKENYFIYEGYSKLKKHIYKKQKEKGIIDNSQFERNLLDDDLLKAEQYFDLAEKSIESEDQAYYYGKAIDSYKKSNNGNTDNCLKAKRKLAECNIENSNDMVYSTMPVDIAKKIKNIKKLVKENNEKQNMELLFNCNDIIKRKDAINLSEYIAKEQLTIFLNAKINMKEKTIKLKEKIIDREGKTITYTSPLNPIYNSTLLMVGKGEIILELIKLIKHKYENIPALFDEIIDQCYIIKEENKHLVKRGMSFCFNFEFDAGLSILIPQVEASIRELGLVYGIPELELKSDYTEEVNTVSYVINNKKFIDKIDEDILFNIEAIFDSKSGLNLRNRFAHGLISKFDSEQYIYAWWFYMILIYIYRKWFIWN